MWLLCVWVPSLRELMSSIMRWRSGLIASVLIGNSCLRSGSRDPDLQDRMTHTLLTISPRVEPYWYAPRPPPPGIAQRFSALARTGPVRLVWRSPLIGVDRKLPARGQTCANDPKQS